MAVRFDQNSFGARSSTPTPRASLTNGTNSRKYVGLDLIRNWEIYRPVRSNAEHVIEQAAGIRTAGMVADKAAAIARIKLVEIRDSINGTVARPKTQTRTPPHALESYDLALYEGQISDEISESFVGEIDQTVVDRINRLAPKIINEGVQGLLPSFAGSLTSVSNPVTPVIERVEIQMDKRKGTVDCFYSTIVFSLSKKLVTNGNIRAIRIFRAEIMDPEFTRETARLSIHGIERMRSDKNRSRSKNQDYSSQMEHRLRESGVDNSITSLIPIDPLRKQRTGANENGGIFNIPPPAQLRPTGDERADFDLKPFLSDTNPFLHLDRSVIQNLNVLRNIQVQNPFLIPKSPIPENSVRGDRNYIHKAGAMGKEAFRQNRDASRNPTSLVVAKNNKQNFREIAFMAPDKLTDQMVGDFIQFTFEDQTISYGRAYRYYMLTVDNNLRESVRSQIVEIHVDGLRIPEPPKSVSTHIISSDVSLSMICTDQLVEKFEVWRKELDPGLKLVQARVVTQVSGKGGFTHQDSIVPRSSNGFQLMGECLNAQTGGASYYDRHVIRGRKYTYRIYSVDIFGNKSHIAKEVSLFVPDQLHHGVELDAPTLLAEVDASTNKARISFKCEDPRVSALFLARRDLTVRQSAFTPPSQVNALKFGDGDHAQGSTRFEDVRYVDPGKSNTWSGYFVNDASGSQQVFIDKTVALDRYYQYQIYGVDRYGNQTPYAFSRRIFIMNRPNIQYPLNLNADISFGRGAIVQGIKVSWEDGNHDITSEERLGDRDELNKHSVRTLFQLERRKIGEQRWFSYPLTELREFFDPTEQGVVSATPVAPNFRPDFIEINETYEYRVTTLQTGAFFSNASPPVQIFVNSPIKPPVDFRIKSSDPKVRPFYVMLNWTTDDSSAIVDKWEIERVTINNAAAERINTRNIAELAALQYSPFTTVHAESSRFSAATSDDSTTRSGGKILPQDLGTKMRMMTAQLQRMGGLFSNASFMRRAAAVVPPPPPAATKQGNGTIVGDHHFMDAGVEFGNTYFYRIRAHAPHGDYSEWVYRGVKVTETIIEIKQDVTLPATVIHDLVYVNHPPYEPPPPLPQISYVTRPLTFTYAPAIVVQAPPPSVSRASILAQSAIASLNVSMFNLFRNLR